MVQKYDETFSQICLCSARILGTYQNLQRSSWVCYNHAHISKCSGVFKMNGLQRISFHENKSERTSLYHEMSFKINGTAAKQLYFMFP